MAVGPAQKTPLISVAQSCPRPGPTVSALGHSKFSAVPGWFVPETALGDCCWAVVRPTAGATRSACRSSLMI